MPELQQHAIMQLLLVKDGRLSITQPNGKTTSLSRLPDPFAIHGSLGDCNRVIYP
ncbi:MAG: hypothetical protein GY943_19370 [Chloroflexi bacterium]|nr:hypothetical protein [Chloroflexota bacterium]